MRVGGELEYVLCYVEGVVNGGVIGLLTVYTNQEDRDDVKEQYSTNQPKQ
jgi:hypothetical protein